MAVALLFKAQAVRAGGVVTAFQQGKPLPKEVLTDVQLKSVVAEFLDPDRTELGREIAYVVWREILTAISDQKGAGVIIARAPEGVRLTDLLQADYHQAAIKVAESQRARMAVWGAVDEEGGRLLVDTYLSMVGDTRSAELAVKLLWGLPGDLKDSGFTTRLSRTAFNFPRVSTTREALFVRPLTAQGKSSIRDRPVDGAVIGSVADGDLLQADGMKGGWFRIRMKDGRQGFVDAWKVYVPPTQVEALRDPGGGDLKLRGGIEANAQVVSRVPPASLLAVLQSRYTPGRGLWYRVRAPQGEGWVPATAVLARFSFPVVHFVAGLYRYQLGRYGDAAREFEEYVRSDGVAADPASLSSAYQMLAASRLMTGSFWGGSGAGATFKSVDEYIALAARTTPFDPSVHSLAAVATIARTMSIGQALPSLERALELDSENADARALLRRMVVLLSPAPAGPISMAESLVRSEGTPALRAKLDALDKRYGDMK
ncbi:MAG: SH3 domain-containing protein [Deltaproteobacteria bacterium]